MKTITRKSLNELAKIMPVLSKREMMCCVAGIGTIPPSLAQSFLNNMVTCPTGIYTTEELSSCMDGSGAEARFSITVGQNTIGVYMNVGSLRVAGEGSFNTSYQSVNDFYRSDGSRASTFTFRHYNSSAPQGSQMADALTITVNYSDREAMMAFINGSYPVTPTGSIIDNYNY